MADTANLPDGERIPILMDEREHIERIGPGRRKEDETVCALHNLLQDETKDHRKRVCDKISLKADAKDMAELRWFIGILVTVSMLVFAGMGAWLKMDLSRQNEVIEKGFASTHRRITENASIRETNDKEQVEKLGSINTKFELVTQRLGRIEEDMKEIKPKINEIKINGVKK